MAFVNTVILILEFKVDKLNGLMLFSAAGINGITELANCRHTGHKNLYLQ